MNELKRKLHCLYKLNQAAKTFGKLKQENYNKGEHDKTKEYKKIQKYIYMMKSLTIADLLERGDIKKGTRAIDPNNTLLESFVSVSDDGMPYYFHGISIDQKIKKEENLYHKRGKKDQEESEIWLPYYKFLYKHLVPKYKNFIDIIIKNDFDLNEPKSCYGLEFGDEEFDKISKGCDEFVDLINSLHMQLKVDTPDILGDVSLFTVECCSLYLHDMQVAKIKIKTLEEYEFFSEDGLTTFEYYDEYDAMDCY